MLRSMRGAAAIARRIPEDARADVTVAQTALPVAQRGRE